MEILNNYAKAFGRKAENERKKTDASMNIYREIIENISEGVNLVRASDNVIVYTNPKLDEMFGYAPGELIGKHISVINAPAGTSPEESEAEILAFLVKRGIWQGEIINIKRNGTPFLCNASISALEHSSYGKAFLSVHTDITEYKREQKKIIEQINYLQKPIYNMPIPIFYKDRNGQYTSCNRSFEEFIGLTKDELLGKIAYDIGPKEIADNDFEKDNELFQNPGTQTYELKIMDKEGNVKEVIFNKSTFNDSQGNVAGLVGIISDVTSLKQLEKYHRVASTTDELTGLLNRRGFLTLAQKQCYIANRNNLNLYILFLDLDGLKEINDRHGHKVGDTALIDAANRLVENFRTSDIIARIGGDEFVVISVETPEIDINILTRRLKENLTLFNSKSLKPYKLSFSMGLTRYNSEKPCSVDELLSKADKMMYEEKKRKKGIE